MFCFDKLTQKKKLYSTVKLQTLSQLNCPMRCQGHFRCKTDNLFWLIYYYQIQIGVLHAFALLCMGQEGK